MSFAGKVDLRTQLVTRCKLEQQSLGPATRGVATDAPGSGGLGRPDIVDAATSEGWRFAD
ncbi:hypothetical protein J1614_000196 [Plenodomus biglobosus]|nr:hypothetical protein J1614_000196 [Plenodomus biglobosus]